jgi:hypothetical protein
LYLLDRQGRLAAIVPFGTPEQRLFSLVSELLAGPEAHAAATDG